MSFRAWLSLLGLTLSFSALAAGHMTPPSAVQLDSLGDELTVGNTREPTSTAHAAFVSNRVMADVAVADQWLLGASYVFSLVQGVGVSHTPGVDVTYVLDEHLAIALAIDGTPPTRDTFPLCLNARRGATCRSVAEQLWSVGGSALVSWDSAGRSNFEWGVDGGYSPNLFELNFSRARVADAPGIDQSLWQHRVNAGLTGRFFRVADVDLRGAYYVYSGDNDLLHRPVLQLTGGLPIAPRSWEAALSVTGHFLSRKLNAKVGFLFAPYADLCLGTSAQLTGKLSGVVGPIRLWGSVLVQADRPPTDSGTLAHCTSKVGGVTSASLSTYASVGADYAF